MSIIAASDSSLLVTLGDSISPEVHAQVVSLFRRLLGRRDARISNLHPACASVLIDFDPLRTSHEELKALVEQILEHLDCEDISSANLVTLPVCYDEDFGPDLVDVAAHSGLTKEDVIELHSSATYVVHFLGFSPGFAYLGGLPQVLQSPRLTTPRTRVPRGSVGIAGEQTAVYPIESPGGWRIIGRTPIRLFDPQGSQPTKLQPGDKVRFTRMARAAFSALAEEE
jgi:inhibitor of KinA